MRGVRIPVVLAAMIGVALLALGIAYVTVPCENLPGILGPHPGDTSPRTGLGIGALVLGAAVLVVAFIVTRRRPPAAPLHS